MNLNSNMSAMHLAAWLPTSPTAGPVSTTTAPVAVSTVTTATASTAQAPQVVSVRVGLHSLALVADADLGGGSFLERLREAGVDLHKGQTPALPVIGDLPGKLVQLPKPCVFPFQEDNRKYRVDYGEGLSILVGELWLETQYLSACVQVSGELCAKSTLQDIGNRARELATTYIGSDYEPFVEQLVVYVDLIGARAETFFDAYKDGRFHRPAGLPDLRDGDDGFLYIGPEPMELLITNVGSEQNPVSRVALRFSGSVLAGKHAIKTTSDIVHGMERPLVEATSSWCCWNGTNMPKAALAPLWAVVPKAFSAWAQQLAQTQGTELVYRGDISAKPGVIKVQVAKD
jgi:hypothetical protein